MTRTDTIRTLLERRHELTDPQRSGNGHGSGGVTLMPHEPRCNLLARDAKPPAKPVYRQPVCTCRYRNYAELDRLLEHMRADRAAALIGDAKHSLRSLHWHIRERYLNCDYAVKTIQFVAGRAVGVAGKRLDRGAYRPTVTPLARNQALVEAKPVNWEAEVAMQRRRRAHTPVESRVIVATWNAEVQPVKVELGIGWIAASWTLAAEPEIPVERLVA